MDVIRPLRPVGDPLGVSRVDFVMFSSWLDKQTLKMVLTMIFYLFIFFLAVLLAILRRGPMIDTSEYFWTLIDQKPFFIMSILGLFVPKIPPKHQF